jgi:hypothetical protein
MTHSATAIASSRSGRFSRVVGLPPAAEKLLAGQSVIHRLDRRANVVPASAIRSCLHTF